MSEYVEICFVYKRWTEQLTQGQRHFFFISLRLSPVVPSLELENQILYDLNNFCTLKEILKRY